MTEQSPVDRLLAGVTDPTAFDDAVFADDTVLDATTPGWRSTLHGRDLVSRQLRHWFADPARFEEITRTALPDGELIRFVLTWTEHGVPHACHQAHIVTVADGRIARDVMFCGGRWPAALLAEMEAERVGA